MFCGHLPLHAVGGTTGVFDLKEIIALLRDENLHDVCAIRVPLEYKYVDFMVIATGKSTRHIQAVAALIQWAVSADQLINYLIFRQICQISPIPKCLSISVSVCLCVTVISKNQKCKK